MNENKMNEIVYKIPGKNHGPMGKTYDWKPVKSKDEFNQAMKDGWFDTLDEAINGRIIDVEPTREEMNKKAKELGLKYGPNTSDANLLKLINDEVAKR
jgi:hypothetical protein